MLKAMPLGPYPVQVWICTSPADLIQYSQKLGYEDPDTDDLASVTNYEPNPGELSVVVYFGPEFLSLTNQKRYGVVTHESVHVWQDICRHICESNAGIEVEANSVQWIFDWLVEQLSAKGWIK